MWRQRASEMRAETTARTLTEFFRFLLEYLDQKSERNALKSRETEFASLLEFRHHFWPFPNRFSLQTHFRFPAPSTHCPHTYPKLIAIRFYSIFLLLSVCFYLSGLLYTHVIPHVIHVYFDGSLHAAPPLVRLRRANSGRRFALLRRARPKNARFVCG